MKKKFVHKIIASIGCQRILVFIFSFLLCEANSQPVENDRSKHIYADRIAADQLNAISKKYWMKKLDSSMYYAQRAYQLSTKNKYEKGIAESYRNMGVANMYRGEKIAGKKFLLKALALFSSLPDSIGMAATYNNLGVLHTFIAEYPVSIAYLDSALMLFRKLDNKEGEGSVLNYIGISYQNQGNYQKAIDYCLQAFEIRKRINDHPGVVFSLLNVGNMYLDVGQPQTALSFYNQGVSHAKNHKMDPPDYLLNQIGKTYLKLKQYNKAESYLVRTMDGKSRQISDYLSAGELYAQIGRLDSAISMFKTILALDPEGNYNNRALSLVGLSKIFFKKKQFGLAMAYANQAYSYADSPLNKLTLAEAANMLSLLYRNNGEYKKAIQFFELAHSITDSVSSENYQQKLAFTESKNEIENKQASIKLLSAEKGIQEQKLKDEQLLKRLILVLFVVAIILSFIIIRSINNKRKKIQLQKDQIEYQKTRVENAYEKLKSAQAQLIQSEKMASLGELTTGIAHEIQNPLNFVNNFSDVNQELLAELKEEANKGNVDEVKTIANALIENENKINHHGKRADAIVKGMLQHSRASTGKKEQADINALADEYLRLSHHGFRAKEKDFNADIKTLFDKSIGTIEVVPQDIGRVLLNLYNNAFYAASLPSKGGFNNSTPNNHKPTVWVTTTKLPPSGGGEAGISISVKDNGPGIPEKILDKIFQPFFTTKPTGQGTGLGLSLSYDIVKAHGGELKVETTEGEGAEFIVLLPLT